MEELVAVAVFGLGASVGLKATRAFGGGLRSIVRVGLIGGIVAGKAARTTASRLSGTIASASTDARRGLDEIRAEAETEIEGSRRVSARTMAGARRIRVVKEDQAE